MPLQPGGVSKTKRLQTVLEILRRAGKLDKVEITARVAAVLATEAPLIARAIYRDLQELVDDGQIAVFYQAPDGKWLNPQEAEGFRNIKCHWGPVGIEQFSISGVLELNQVGGDILASKTLSRCGKLKKVPANGPTKNSVGLVFNVGGKGFFLELEPESFPITIIVARNKDTGEVVSKRENRALPNQRSIVLLLPTATLTALRPEGKVGHFSIKFNSESSFEIKDLGSKNGTTFYNSDLNHWDEINEIIGLGSTTDLKAQTNAFKQNANTQLPKDQSFFINRPSVVSAAEIIQFVVLLVHPKS